MAEANEQEVLRLWQGLGYYSRARNLLRTAKQIHYTHQGQWPQTAKALIQLPGIGAYTAAAIASLAYQEPGACIGWQCVSCGSTLFCPTR